MYTEHKDGFVLLDSSSGKQKNVRQTCIHFFCTTDSGRHGTYLEKAQTYIPGLQNKGISYM